MRKKKKKLKQGVVTMYLFRLATDTGRSCLIKAKTRTEAIRKYCKETGMPEEWFNAHCTIKRMWRVIE